jgi:hypothetical protein
LAPLAFFILAATWHFLCLGVAELISFSGSWLPGFEDFAYAFGYSDFDFSLFDLLLELLGQLLLHIKRPRRCQMLAFATGFALLVQAIGLLGSLRRLVIGATFFQLQLQIHFVSCF